MTKELEVHQTVVIRDNRLMLDRLMYEGVDSHREVPKWSNREVAKMFGKPHYWLLRHYNDGNLFLDDDPSTLPDFAPGEYRAYTLPEIERMSHALAQRGIITVDTLISTLLILRSLGRAWDYPIP